MGTKDYGQGTVDKLKDAASNLGEKTKDAASAAASAAGEAVSGAASSLGKSADKMASSAGSSVKHLGETIKAKGPQDGVLGGATRAVADTIQEGGRYLEQEGFSGMVEDTAELIRRNPLPAVLVGIGVGFLIGRTLGS
jgi:ElaB/YqjD/DUF883 family membrane-anchored ribosome-binding protein